MNRLGFLRKTILYLILTVSGFFFLLPFLWMVSTALKLTNQTYIYPPVWIPHPATFTNFIEAFQVAPLARFIWNSCVVTSLAVVGTVISTALVAYSFGRLRWPGRNFLFVILLTSMMLPAQVTMIPVFLIFHKFGMVGNTLKPLIVPSFFCAGLQGAFYVFLVRQFVMTIPRELDEAARIDGCGFVKIFSRIVVPLVKPALGAVAVFSFMENWNEFMTALIYLNDKMKYTLPIGLQYFKFEDTVNWNQLMSASLIALIPCIVIFFIGQRYFMRGVTLDIGTH